MLQKLAFRGPFRGINRAYDSSFNPVTDAEDAKNLVLSAGTLEKRNGWVERANFSEEGSPRGGHDYIKNDGTTITLFKIGGNLYAVQVAGSVWSTTLLSTDGVAGLGLVDFETVNNRAYIADGESFKVTDGNQVFTAEITKPAAPPGNDPAAGSLTGQYEHRYTYYSSTWGQESLASDKVVNDEVVANQSIDLLLTRTTDARVDKFRIYRRKSLPDNETLWYFVKEENHTPGSGTVTVNDNVPDEEVDKNTIAPVGSVVSPIPSFFAYQADVLFMAGNPSAPNLLYHTLPGQPWAIVGSLPIGSTGDADPITGLASYQGLVVVFKRRSIWTVHGNDKDTFFVRKVHSGLGAVGHHSIVPAPDGMIYFMAEDGFYLWDGAKPVPISRPVQDLVTDRNFSRDPWAVGCNLYDQGAILWSFTASGSTTNQRHLVYFYRYSQEVEFPSWCPWTFDLPVAYPFLVTDATTRKRLPVFAFDVAGVLGAYEGSADGGDVLPWFWRTGKVNAGDASRIKAWGMLDLEMVPQAVGALLDIRYYLDQQVPNDLQAGHDQSDPLFSGRMRRSSREIRLEFGSNNSSKAELIGWDLEYELAKNA